MDLVLYPTNALLPDSILLQLKIWREQLQQQIPGTQFEIDGSLIMGLHPGVTAAHLSMNTNKESLPNNLFEVDVLCHLPVDFDIKNPKSQSNLYAICNAQKIDAEKVYRWGTTYDGLFIYCYLNDHDICYEIQILCFNQPHVSASKFWPDVFSKDEIIWQKNIRDALRKSPESTEALRIIKALQGMEARWRIIASLACHDQGIDGPRFECTEGENQFFYPRIKSWLAGESGADYLDRSLDPAPKKLLSPFGIELKELSESLPDEPEWVTVAESLCWRLKAERVHQS